MTDEAIAIDILRRLISTHVEYQPALRGYPPSLRGCDPHENLDLTEEEDAALRRIRAS